MSFDSQALFEGLKKSDLKKLSYPSGYDWKNYYDLNFWLLADEGDHEPLDVHDGRALLSAKILRQLRTVISTGGFGINPEIDAEYKEKTLSFIADALLTIRLGGRVFYQSDEMPSCSSMTSTDSTREVMDGKKTQAILNAAMQLKATAQPITPAVIVSVLARQGFKVSSFQVSDVLCQDHLGLAMTTKTDAKHVSRQCGALQPAGRTRPHRRTKQRNSATAEMTRAVGRPVSQAPHASRPAANVLTRERLNSLSTRLSDWKEVSNSADFSAYDEITPEAAAALARYCFNLDLSGLKVISPDVIRALNKKVWEGTKSAWHTSSLDLSGLRLLADDCAFALAKRFARCPFPAGSLALNGLREISDSVAVALSLYPGEIHLEKLRRLSPEAASSLARRLRRTHVNLKQWPAGAARVFYAEATNLTADHLRARHPKDLEDLTHFTSLTDEAAAILCKSKAGYISLGITSITDAAAKSLSRSRVGLSLDSLATLSEAAAVSFGGHRHELSLDGVATLSDSAAIALGRHRGTLSLNGLRSISDVGAEGLRRNQGALHLNGLKRLSDMAASCLGKHRGMLWLNAVQRLSDDAATALALHKRGDLTEGYIELSLTGLRDVPASVAGRLAMHRGSLALNVNQLSEQALAAVISHPGLDLDCASDTTKKKIAALKQKRGKRKCPTRRC